jgi:hypothetical protein
MEVGTGLGHQKVACHTKTFFYSVPDAILP